MKRSLLILLALGLSLSLLSCSSSADDDVDDDVADDDAGDDDVADDDSAGDDDTAGDDDSASDSRCYPEGIYGICEDLGCPLCLSTTPAIYESCSSSCTDTPECGDPADYNGATPFCAPLNPGAEENICVLICTAPEQCPCGLDCLASGAGVDICAVYVN